MIQCAPDDKIRSVISRALAKEDSDDRLHRILSAFKFDSMGNGSVKSAEANACSTDSKNQDTEMVTAQVRNPDRWRIKVLGRCDYFMDINRRLVASMHVQKCLRKIYRSF